MKNRGNFRPKDWAYNLVKVIERNVEEKQVVEFFGRKIDEHPLLDEVQNSYWNSLQTKITPFTPPPFFF